MFLINRVIFRRDVKGRYKLESQAGLDMSQESVLDNGMRYKNL